MDGVGKEPDHRLTNLLILEAADVRSLVTQKETRLARGVEQRLGMLVAHDLV